MKQPTLRYGNPAELRHYAAFIPRAELARRLRRSEKTIDNWLKEREKVPWWVPEILRLQKMEFDERMRQMGMRPARAALGVVGTAGVIEFKPRDRRTQVSSSELRQTALKHG